MLEIAQSLSEVPNRRLTKTEQKKLRRQGLLNGNVRVRQEQEPRRGLFLNCIKPKTINQSKIFKSYEAGKSLLLHGLPGTGKTFLSLFLSLQEVMNGCGPYKKVVIVRSAVPTRDIGFLPGNKTEKMAEYEAPYRAICAELFGRANAYELLKSNGMIEFFPTSYIRGLTISDAIVIVDEMQNLTGHELDSVITRLGDNSKIIFSGDFRQSDFRFNDEKRGIVEFMEVLEKMKGFVHIELGVDDIVRSGIVREYIITKAEIGRV